MAWDRNSIASIDPRAVTLAPEAANLRYRNFGPPPPAASSVPAGAASPAAAPVTRHRHCDILRNVTVGIVETFARCCGEFAYSQNEAPRRVLTKLSKAARNAGYDNEEDDYICRVGETIVNRDGQAYEIMDFLGRGTFGQVLKCQAPGCAPIALKVIKNNTAYFRQALIEVGILQMLNKEFDPEDENRIVRMIEFFEFRNHFCIVFELLSCTTLYDALKQTNFRGVKVALVRVLTEQLVQALRCLRQASVIHCDLKPENILFSTTPGTPSITIKLIDFGAACLEKQTPFSYIQSRFYRSPEVLIGAPYSGAIDMWSLGCISAELFLGLPIFPGHSEYDQVCRISEILDIPPPEMLNVGKHTRRYFRKQADDDDVVGEPSLVSRDHVGGEVAAPEISATTPTASHRGGLLAQQDVGRDESLLNLVEEELDVRDDISGPSKTTAFKDGLQSRGQSAGSGQSTTAAEIGEPPTRRRAWTGAAGQQSNAPLGDASSEDDLSAPACTAVPSLGNRPSRQRRRVSRTAWRLKTRDEFEKEQRQKAPISKKYFNFKSLEEMIEIVPFKQTLTPQQQTEEGQRRLCLLQFLRGALQLNPAKRWTPKQAALSPFVLGTCYDANFQPPLDDPEPPVTRMPTSPSPASLSAHCGSVAPSFSSGVSSTVSTPTVRDGASAASGGHLQTPQAHGSGTGVRGAPPQGGGAASSRTWSRCSSPWHLPSPMSDRTSCSEQMQYVSQPSASETSGERLSQAWGGSPGNLDESVSEDPSQSDTSGSQWQRSTQCSDSDSLTPQSRPNRNGGKGGGVGEPGGAPKDPQVCLWENFKLSRDKLPTRLDSTLNSARGNFREKVGMNETGPVNPLIGHGPRLDGLSSMMRSNAPATSGGGCGGGEDAGRTLSGSLEGSGGVGGSGSARGSGGGGTSGSDGGPHGRRRGRLHRGSR
eukprot:TRINITY_DN42777_c0_g1_i1.p1 TRINITY_DN42777_c0_g1~~TRINITY_DN42777_c0_g1_i1.p1  ORF type:complete len:933 (+),score=129.28 TRINITY_DN42777_c0_g1_i1:71-2869(+)